MFEDFEIEIHCPDCDTAMTVMLGQIAREESVTCPCCKKVIHMKPDPEPTPEQAKEVEKFFDSIDEAVRKIKGDS
jgi:uncharacterized paraquat-inducible protein A